ncbi:MAG: hypothetical protein M1832_005295 [Thelocarpon impressellum]|nr:MAG: hypothetical protein M1832_005295 [Thelocarpon impressellum]
MGGTTPQRPVAAAPPTAPTPHPPQQIQLQPYTPRFLPASLPYATPQSQAPAAFGYAQPRGTGNTYVPPKPVEVYQLNDAANVSIPPEVRQRFQRDEQGRLLFFTAPPLDNSKEAGGLGHSVRYLGEKARRKDMLAAKRKAVQEAREKAEETVKRARLCLSARSRNNDKKFERCQRHVQRR